MSLSDGHSGVRLCAGLVAGPAAWAVSTELGQMLPYAACRSGMPLLLPVSAVAMLVAMAGAAVSWRAAARPVPRPRIPSFTGMLSALAGLVFAFAILLQAVASLLLSGCER